MPNARLQVLRRCWRICPATRIGWLANSRLVALDERGVTFNWKDYRAKGATRYKTMTLSTGEFMRRFLLHVLPGGFHRIRHYGLIANGGRSDNLAKARELLHVAPVSQQDAAVSAEPLQPTFVVRPAGRTYFEVKVLYSPDKGKS